MNEDTRQDAPVPEPDAPDSYEKPQRARKLLKWAAILSLSGVLLSLAGLSGLYLYITPGLPDVERLKEVRFQEPLRVYSADGKLVAEYGEMRRLPLSMGQIPEVLQNAFIAAEDDRFWQHPGVDYQGLLRAAWNLLRTGDKTQGGSTITMQVARNFFLSREKTYLRKLNEIFLALKIEKELSKAQVLELYLNKIYLGQRAYGVGAAAQIYYGLSVHELNLAQAAMIAGLPKAPSAFNPIVNPQRALERRNYVLKRMRELNMIDADAYMQAVQQTATAKLHETPIELEALYAGEMVRALVVERYGEEAYSTGLKVYTTLDSRLQKAAVEALRQGLLQYERRHGYRGAVAELDASEIELLQQLMSVSQEKQAEATNLLDRLLGGILDEQENIMAAQETLAERLRVYGSFGGLRIAVVAAVSEQSAMAYLADGTFVNIPWEGLSWAGAFIDTERKGSAPKKATDVLAIGDIVWLNQQGSGEYALAQVPEVEGAIVALNSDDGSIQALTGGFDFFRSKFNRVVQAERQPGSNFKPFIYSAALENGFTAASIFNDAPVVFDDPTLEDKWKPENYSGRFFGPTRLREGLVKSRNLVSVRLLMALGVSKARQYARRFGFDDKALPRDYSLTLGSGTLTPLQMARGFAVFANGGYLVDPFLVDRIVDNEGREIYLGNYRYVCANCEAQTESDDKLEAEQAVDETTVEEVLTTAPLASAEIPADPVLMRDIKPAERIMEPRVAYIMNNMLKEVVKRGTAVKARQLGRNDIGGKTGTTNDFVDAWFSGFNRRLVATAWMGYDTRKSLGYGEAGARAALPIWIDFMRVALADKPEENLPQPEGITTIRIDPQTGLLANSDTPDAIFEIFKNENVPLEISPRVAQPANPENGGEPPTQEIF